LSQVADDAIDHGHMASNPARGKSANISNRVLAKAIERANARLEEAGMPSIAAGVANHTLHGRSLHCSTRPAQHRLT
jgi:hypothetical protein